MAGSSALALGALICAASRAKAEYTKPGIGGVVRYVRDEDIEVPTLSSFPGTSAAYSNAAWSTGRQPEPLQYWPQMGYGTLKRRMLPCDKTYVLEDHVAGWPGVCQSLERNKMINTAPLCKEFCHLEPRCSVWQFVNHTRPGECWVGYGTRCGDVAGRQDRISVEGAQRLQHGDVKVLAYLQGVRLLNLWNLPLTVIDPSVGQKKCQEWCYSDIACDYWQYNAQKGGCYVDARMFSTNKGTQPSKVVQYPLSLDGGAEQAADWHIGEYIAHYCPPAAAAASEFALATPAPVQQPPAQVEPVAPPERGVQPVPTPVRQEGSDDDWTLPWAWIAALIAVILLCAAAVWFLFQQSQPTPKKSSPAQRPKGGGGAARRNPRPRDEREEYESGQSFKQVSSFEEDRPLMMASSAPPSEVPAGRFQGEGYDDREQYGGGPPRQTTFQQQLQTQPQQQHHGGGHAGGAGYSQGGSRDHGGAATRQPGGAAGAGGYGGNPGMPPPTQLMDFGQNPGNPMAPTQLLNPGMPFPVPSGRGGYNPYGGVQGTM